jgi:hypothetical protein
VGGSTVARAAGGGFDDRALDDRALDGRGFDDRALDGRALDGRALDASGRRTDVPARRSGVVVPGTP